MSTYIIIGVCLFFILAVAARDIFYSRKLHGTTSEEWLGHQYDYEKGFPLLFKRLPEIRLFGRLRLGSLGSLLVFIVLIPYVLGLLASFADGALFLPGDEMSFFEDYTILPMLVAIAVTFYFFRKVMDMVPETFRFILNDTSAQRALRIEICLERVAAALFQTKKGGVKWGRALDVGLTILFASLIAFVWASIVNNPSEPGGWGSPKHFWGNMFGIIEFSLAFVYVVPRGLGYLIRLVWCMRYFAKKLEEEGLLRIEPLNPDDAGGFGIFGKLAWRIDLVVLPTLIMAVFYYMTGYGYINTAYISGLIITILLIPIFFFGPLWGLHRVMVKTKSEELRILSQQYNLNVSIVRRWLKGEEGIKRIDGLAAKEVLDSVILMHEQTSRMPVWPFDATTLTRVLGYFLLPIVAIVLQAVL